jgi:molecular chaperone IbpA
VLAIEGRKAEDTMPNYLYQGISPRQFKRTFSLADYVKVEGASFENGLLRVKLVREIPEAMKPRQIPISTGGNLQIENKQSA